MIPLDTHSRHKILVRVFEPPHADMSAPLKILLLKLDHIGDFITALDAFRILRTSFRDSDITLFCLPACVALAESTGLFDTVIGFPGEPNSEHIGRVFQIDRDDRLELFKSLLKGPYVLAVDLKHEASSRTWLDHVDATYRAGFAAPTRHGLDILLPAMEWHVPTSALAAKNLPIHAGARLSLLAHAIVDGLAYKRLNGPVFLLPPRSGCSEAIEKLTADPRPKIGMSVGAGAELRMWSTDYWVSFLSRLIQTQGALIVFFGSQADRQETNAVLSRLPAESCLDLVGVTPLSDVPHYMRVLTAYIGCDTGLTHLAAELDLPTVNIFAGISNVSVWRARGSKTKTVYAEVACAPCHLRFKNDCPNGNLCMTVILPDIVYACFEQVITC